MTTSDARQMSAPVDVYVSAGSNIAPEDNLRLACRELEADFGALSLSAVYQTPAVGFDGDDFLNMVIGFRTAVAPDEVVARMEGIHAKAERVRLPDPYSPRTLDLDVLLYGGVVQRRLKLPHGDIEKYDFVLGPLAELAPQVRHPVVGKTLLQMWQDFDQGASEMQRVELDLAVAQGR